jgi:hypothetical protein
MPRTDFPPKIIWVDDEIKPTLRIVCAYDGEGSAALYYERRGPGDAMDVAQWKPADRDPDRGINRDTSALVHAIARRLPKETFPDWAREIANPKGSHPFE